jgi:hypothetical protein
LPLTLDGARADDDGPIAGIMALHLTGLHGDAAVLQQRPFLKAQLVY